MIFNPFVKGIIYKKMRICKDEKETNKIYSVKNIPQFNSFYFEIPWEKKVYDINDINTKVDTYWYDPIEFSKKLMNYCKYIHPIVLSIKNLKIKNNF